MKIEILNPVWSKLSPKEEIKKILPCLSYEKEFWIPGEYKKEQQNIKAYMIDQRNGEFLTGLIPRIIKYSGRMNLQVELDSPMDFLSPQNLIPQLPGFTPYQYL